MKEFGTAKGLEPDPMLHSEGSFRMQMGNLCISIRPDIRTSGCIVVSVGMSTAGYRCIAYFDRDTLEPNFGLLSKYKREERREDLGQWVYSSGPESCHKLIDKIWGE